MFASRIFVALFALFFCIITTLSAPIEVDAIGDASEEHQLEKRVKHTGRLTWFNVGLGNCGKWNKDTDKIVAISKARYDAENGANCGQYMTIMNLANGKSTIAYVADSCPSCEWDALDVSPAVFQAIGNLDTGVLQGRWEFKARGWKPAA